MEHQRARAEAMALRRRIDQGEDPLAVRQADRAQPTVADLAQRFRAEYLPRKRPSTAASYASLIDGHPA
jgi:hypothetical protein